MSKRLFDIVLSGLGLLVLSPLLIVTCIAVRLKLGAPVVFRQTRPGFGGRPFIIHKFRTMTDECDAAGELLPDVQRLGGMGRFLRATSLDELPELWNVLRGDMSLVGPRPLLTEYLNLYNTRQIRRQEVRPGITGWAQVNGRNAISWEEKLEMDVWYVNNRSFWLDVRILWMTLGMVLRREGISQHGHATAERFKGNGRCQ